MGEERTIITEVTGNKPQGNEKDIHRVNQLWYAILVRMAREGKTLEMSEITTSKQIAALWKVFVDQLTSLADRPSTERFI